MDLLNKKAVNAAIILLIAINLYYFYFVKDKEDNRFERISQQYEEKTEENVCKAMEEADVIWKQTVVALNEHKLEEAQDLYKAGREKINFHLSQHGYQEMKPGLTLSDWKKEQDTVLLEALQTELRILMDKLKSGEVNPNDVESFFRGFNDFAFRDLESEYNNRKSEIEKARAVHASKWIRVIISDYIKGYQFKYGGIVENALRSKWIDDRGYTLVFARSMGQFENNATLKTLTVKVEEEDAQYEFENNIFINRAQPVIPIKVTVSFSMEGDEEFITGWDNLYSLEAEAPAPDTLWVKEKKSGSLDEADKLVIENRGILERDIQLKLNQLPPFEFFPGQDTDRLTLLTTEGGVDTKSAMALTFKSPRLFKSQLGEAIQSVTPETLGDLQYLVIKLEQDAHAKWLAQTLKEADINSQKKALRALENKPRTWGYGPILVLTRRGHDSVRTQALYTLRGQLHHAKVKKTLKAIANNPGDPRRIEFANFILNESPKEDLHLYTHWIKDSDHKFAAETFQRIKRKDQDLTRKLVVEYYAEVSPELKEKMLSHFTFRYEGADPKDIALLKNAVLQTESARIRTNALNSLLNAPYLPGVWWSLNELKTASLSSKEKSIIERELIYSVDRGNPNGAKLYLMAEIKRLQSAVKEVPSNQADALLRGAIGKLIGMDGQKDEWVASLAEIIIENPTDHDFLHNALLALQQYHRIRDGWNWDQQEMENILYAGAKHPNLQTRQFTYKVAGYALGKSHRQYASLLEQAHNLESDPKLLKQIEEYLQ